MPATINAPFDLAHIRVGIVHKRLGEFLTGLTDADTTHHRAHICAALDELRRWAEAFTADVCPPGDPQRSDALAHIEATKLSFAGDGAAFLREALRDAAYGLFLDGDPRRLEPGSWSRVETFTALSRWLYSSDAPTRETLKDVIDAIEARPRPGTAEGCRTLLANWPERLEKLLADTDPVACLVLSAHARVERLPLDRRYLVVRSGLRAVCDSRGLGVYPRLVARWLVAGSDKVTRAGEPPGPRVRIIEGAPTDLDADQWHAALVLHLEAPIESIYGNPAAALCAAAQL